MKSYEMILARIGIKDPVGLVQNYYKTRGGIGFPADREQERLERMRKNRVRAVQAWRQRNVARGLTCDGKVRHRRAPTGLTKTEYMRLWRAKQLAA